MAALGTITCRLCGTPISVEFTRAGQGDGVTLMVADIGPLAEHYDKCQSLQEQPAKAVEPRKPELSVPPVELSGRIERLLNGRAPHGGRFFVAKGGSRACTMCGMAGASCLSLVGQNTREACCPACTNGNTHPAPGEAQGSCQEWAAENGATS